MFPKTNFKYFVSLILLIISTPVIHSQVGVNTDSPTSTLDINGDLRIRTIDVSQSTDDDMLVVGSDGVVKKSITSNSFFRGYLSDDFTSGSVASTVYKITNFTIIDQPGSEFDVTNSTFTPDYSGLYNIVLTLTSTAVEEITTTNVVYGLVDNETGKWVMRFSVPKDYIQTIGLNSSSGAVNSFSGAVMLTKGKVYYLGVTNSIKLISHPSGNTGDGIGSYLAIELLKTY